LQVETFVGARHSALCLVGAGILLCGAAGCHRPPGADVVASVNDKEIMRADLEKNYKASLGDNPDAAPSPQQADIQRLNILRGMIDDEILQQRAAKLNLVASDEDVNAKITDLKALSTQEEFERQLKAHGQTLDDLKRQFRRALTSNKLLNKEIESKINITDAEITNYYNTHKSEFNFIEPRYHVAEIVVTGAPPPPPGNPQARRTPNETEARKEIENIRSRLQSGDDFGTLAAQFSENANIASNGGDMGFIPESQLRSEPEVYNAVIKLKPGQLTDVIPVYDPSGPGRRFLGIAIYKLLGREAAGQREINDPRVQQTIRTGLHESHSQLLKNAYYEKLHDDAKIRNYFAEQILRQGAQ
jgi:peptidyl-prolyl cis-trans isomerase SurA